MMCWIIKNVLYENISINCTSWVWLIGAVIFCQHCCQHCLSEPKAAIIAKTISYIIIESHAKI